MWDSASCSDRARRWALAAVLASSLAAGASPAWAKRLLSQPQALEAAFGAGAAVERQPHYLTARQVERAQALAGAGVRLEGALVTRYLGRREGRLLGTAYFDTHRVRTLEETLMIVVTPEGTVARVEVLAFGEPGDYLPRRAWYQQFGGRRLDRELGVSRGIHGVTGATLSARAATEAVRRTLAIHQVLEAQAP
jgi:hypothetical protein